MTVRLSVALLLLLVVVEVVRSHQKCMRPVPSNCVNNPRIELYKINNNQTYQLWLRSNHNRVLPAAGVNLNWINCSEVCDVCQILKPVTECSHNYKCEEHVDSFLDEYCTSVLPERIITVTANGTKTSIGLGIALGLSMVLVVVITTALACTCWTMKKREDEKNLTQKRNSGMNPSDERSLDNPIYGGNCITQSELELQGHFPVATTESDPINLSSSQAPSTQKVQDNNRGHPPGNCARRDSGTMEITENCIRLDLQYKDHETQPNTE